MGVAHSGIFRLLEQRDNQDIWRHSERWPLLGSMRRQQRGNGQGPDGGKSFEKHGVSSSVRQGKDCRWRYPRSGWRLDGEVELRSLKRRIRQTWYEELG